MAYREQEIVQRCAFCDAAAHCQCDRCELPCCDTHSHPDSAWCTQCETEYGYQPRPGLGVDAEHVCLFMLALYLGIMLVGGTGGALVLGLVFMLITTVVGTSVHQLQLRAERRARKRFGKRAERALLPATSPDDAAGAADDRSEE